QADRIEQFLPNLATRAELVAQIQDAKRHAMILNEATRDEIKLLAENLARVEATMLTREDLEAMATKRDLEAMATKRDLEAMAIKADLEAMPTKRDLTEAIGALERTLGGQIGQVASQIATLAKRRKT